MNYSIDKYYQYFCEQHPHSFELSEGSGVVMFSAPHSVEQTRMGKIKVAERYTGVICKMLHEQICCPVIYKTKNCGDDANFDMQSPYKNALCQYVKTHGVKMVVDLHQLAPARKVAINLGTANFRNTYDVSCAEIVQNLFVEADVGEVRIDYPFKGSKPYTVSSFVRNACGIQTIQIEINSKLLCLQQPNGLMSVFDTLKACALQLNSYLGGANEKRNSDG